MSSTPPGWYDDGHGSLRWWDGQGWTEHAQPYTPLVDSSPTGEVPSAPESVPAPEPVPVPEAPVAPPVPEMPAQQAPVVPEAPAQQAPVAPPVPEAPAQQAPAAPPVPQSPYGHAYGYPPYGADPYGTRQTVAYPTAPAAPPAKSRGWILPVVIVGAVVLLLAAVAIIGIIAFNAFRSVSGPLDPDGPGGDPGPSETGESLGLDHPAVDAVELYDTAYQNADCVLFFDVSSDAFIQNGWDDVECDGFVEQAEQFNATVEGYDLRVTDVREGPDGSVLVITEESYTSTAEEDSGEFYTDYYEYTVVEEGGAWLIDSIGDTAGTQ